VRAPRLHLVPGAALAVLLATSGPVRAQERPAAAALAEEPADGVEITRTPPVTVRITAGGVTREVTLVGRTKTRLAFTEGSSPYGTRRLLDRTQVEYAWFDLVIDDYELNKDLRRRNWRGAARRLLPAVKPALPYLDLPNNNAASFALQVGDYLMRDAERAFLLAATEEEEKAALDTYRSAYAVLRYAGRADWYSGGLIASLKSYQCLLALGKPKTARLYLQDFAEPIEGDAAFGLYWLLTAELAAESGDFRKAMGAAVKSLCFETKDVDTFPDALLLSARCYEELQEWHRARDVYYEVARIFPKTDWSDFARRRLAFIMAKGLTAAEEETPIENVFFGLKEDMNGLVTELLARREEEADEPAEPDDDAWEPVAVEFVEEEEE